MHEYAIDPSDEGRHEPGSERFWSESYYFDFQRDDGSLGGYVRIGICPNLGVTWYWACLVGAGRPLVTVIDHAAPLPAAGSLDLRHGDLAATHRCATPNQSFRLTLAARAIALEDPAETYRGMHGKPTRLRFDLQWETDGPGGYRFRDLTRYEIPCRVSGQLETDGETIAFEGHGQRDHSWGERDWWANAWCWNAGRLADGTRFHSVAPRTLDGQNIPWAAGYVQPPGQPLEPIHSSSAEEALGADGLPTSARIGVGDLHLDVEPLYFSPVLLTDPDGRVSRFPRCLARYSAADGRTGLGWIEWNQPQSG
ncbi:MAG: hypothetical protein JSU66_10625 [Deltaproteobacteria bacterium]|nr:MAG: hypothetical protein JSU66_10625 [Deltaproteobacteria bacterium]